MKNAMIGRITVTGWVFCCLASSGFAAEKEKQQKVKAYPHYWMSISTMNQSIPGMSGEMSGMAAMFGGKGPAFGPKRDLLLQLESPRSMPAKPEANHVIPPGLNMGEALPLMTPKVEKEESSPGQHEMGRYEKPKARMLIYWGCGDEVGKGQPRVIDTARMSMAEFGKAFAGRSGTRQSPPHPHGGWVYGDWPNRDDRKDVPRDGSLVGDHLVQGNYLPDIRFSLDQRRDFMAPVEFSAIEARPNNAMKVTWQTIPTANGYFASAMAHNPNTGETIFWSSSELPETGLALMDYLPPADVSRFIKEQVVMEPSRTSCTVPPVFKDAPGAMLQFIAYGDELNLIHPPKPKDPKQPWDPQWSVKVRLKSQGMTTLMAGDENGRPGRKSSRSTGRDKRVSEEEKPVSNDDESGSPRDDIKKKLRGIFGF